MTVIPVGTGSQKPSLVLDLGTTGVKGFVFSPEGEVRSRVYARLPRSEPRSGWVEFDARGIVEACQTVLREAVKLAGVRASDCVGLGITNQRETVVVWDRSSGEPVYPAIGWEDRRTQSWCEQFVTVDSVRAERIRKKTGLPVDAYFSAPKIRWILEQAASGRTSSLAVGTLDTWIAYNWTGNHVTDLTNASRTLLLDIHARAWDEELCAAFGVPTAMLPRLQSSAGTFGQVHADVLGALIPLRAVIGDQQSSLYAAGTAPGIVKITYGTGAFVMELLGKTCEFVDGLFTTLALGPAGASWYALEGKVEDVVQRVEESPEGGSQWQAALQSIAVDVGQMLEKFPRKPARIVVDGGISKHETLLEFQRTISRCPIERSITADATALGVHKLLQEVFRYSTLVL